jgi:ribosomal protein S18 acetylase RimI-like enzyme
MTLLEAPYRRATPDDARALAELVDLAGDGLPSYLWARMAEPGESPLQVGERRARRDEGSFSWRNAILREEDDTLIGALIGYPLPDRPEPVDPGLPAMFVPLQELENAAPGSWYVNVLAVYPQHHGHGHGTGLLALALRLARAAGSRGLSIIVSNANAGAVRLYERCGYRHAGERPMVKEGWVNPGTAWLLLTKPL